MVFNTGYATTLSVHNSNGSGDLGSKEEVESALLDASYAGVTLGGVEKYFECPIIKVPKGP